MEDKTVGFIVLMAALLSGTAGVVLTPETPLYDCGSKGLTSDCINGVKACDDNGICTRCYWNETNSRQYEYCREGWTERAIENELINTSINPYKICIKYEGQEACVEV